jgi:hypothetical protein
MEQPRSDVPKTRSQAQKVGKHKYELALLHRVENRLERIEQMQRIIFHGLDGYFKFERPLVEKVAAESEMDLAVVGAIFEAGSGGILAKDIIEKLKRYPLERHKILRIVNRVNRNVEAAFGRTIVEKRGKKWAFTEFGVEIWGRTKEDKEDFLSEEDKVGQHEPDEDSEE